MYYIYLRSTGSLILKTSLSTVLPVYDPKVFEVVIMTKYR